MNRRNAIMGAAIGSALIVGSIVTIAATQTPKRSQVTAVQVKPQQQPSFPTTIPSSSLGGPITSPLVEFQAMMNDPAKRYTIEPVRVRGKVKPRTQEEDKLFHAAAAALRRVRPIPAARLQFFGWLDRPDSPLQLYGWHLSVRQVTPTPDGLLVIVSVSPKVFRGGSHAQVSNSMAEEYLWANGNVQFVKAYPLTGAEPSFGW